MLCTSAEDLGPGRDLDLGAARGPPHVAARRVQHQVRPAHFPDSLVTAVVALGEGGAVAESTAAATSGRASAAKSAQTLVPAGRRGRIGGAAEWRRGGARDGR